MLSYNLGVCYWLGRHFDSVQPCSLIFVIAEYFSMRGAWAFFPNSGSYRVLVGSFDRYLRISLQLVPGKPGPAETAPRRKWPSLYK